MSGLAAHPSLEQATIRTAVDTLLNNFLDEQEETTTTPELAVFTSQLRDLLAAGGKRVRPMLCVIGWRAITPAPVPPVVLRLAASLELFHLFTLIHDDIMDQSDTRRGRPTAHRTLAARHAGHHDPGTLGVNTAILLGDLALGWSYELLLCPDVAPEQLAALRPILNSLRTETLVGQYLDLRSSGRPTMDVAAAWRIIRYKTAKYTIERPLQLSALLAGASPPQLDALSAYALPLGDAFQLSDDLLDVFGDPARTGKGTSSDLCEGKHTVLVATALQRATPAERHMLRRHLGNPDLSRRTVQELRDVLTESGARTTIERIIRERCTQAEEVLTSAPLEPAARAALSTFARSVPHRTV